MKRAKWLTWAWWSRMAGAAAAPAAVYQVGCDAGSIVAGSLFLAGEIVQIAS